MVLHSSALIRTRVDVDMLKHYAEDGSIIAESFTNWDEFDAFLAEEQAQWAWVKPGAYTGGAAVVAQKLSAGFNSVRSSGQQHRNRGGSAGHGGATIAQAYNENGGVLIGRGTSNFRDVSEVRELISDAAAVFAAGLLRGFIGLGDAQTRDDIRAALWFAAPGLNTEHQLAELLKKERDNARATVRTVLADAEKSKLARMNDWEQLLRTARAQSLRWARRRSLRWRAATRSWEDRHEKAEASIAAVEASYREAMGLQAPVQYWKDKAAEHLKAERLGRLWVLIYFPVAIAMLVLAFWVTGTRLLDASTADAARSVPPGLYVIASAGLGSAAAMLFWIGRLLTKLYLSEHHLRHDAEERATMTTTYLALTSAKAAEEGDRQIILSALFRATPDGIVKEEGGIDPSIAAALGKFLAKP